jgi:hypothetical protein
VSVHGGRRTDAGETINDQTALKISTVYPQTAVSVRSIPKELCVRVGSVRERCIAAHSSSAVDFLTTGVVKISLAELEDSYFDLDAWIRTAFGKRIARA